MLNLLFTHWIPQWYGASHELTLPGLAKPVVTEVGKITAIWAVRRCSPALCWCWFAAIAISAAGWRREVGRRWAGYSRGDEHRL